MLPQSTERQEILCFQRTRLTEERLLDRSKGWETALAGRPSTRKYTASLALRP